MPNFLTSLLRTYIPIGVGALASQFDSSRIAVMKHLAVLEQANLLNSEKDGRMRRLYFNAIPIRMIYDRWTTEYSALWAERMTGIKYRVESKTRRRSRRGR